jgi:hypothetical protein
VTAPDTGRAGDTNCFEQINGEQRKQLDEYVRQNGSATQTVGVNEDGTQDVCVLEPDGQGGYEEHFYKKEDNFTDYLLYATLTNNARSLAIAGYVTGDLSSAEAIALSTLTSVSDDGSAYHPYHRNDNGSWLRQKTVIKNVKVTHIHYGSQPSKDFKVAKSEKPPAGYGKSVLKTVSSPSIQRGGFGVPGGGPAQNTQQKLPANSGPTAARPTVVKTPDIKPTAQTPKVPTPTQAPRKPTPYVPTKKTS